MRLQELDNTENIFLIVKITIVPVHCLFGLTTSGIIVLKMGHCKQRYNCNCFKWVCEQMTFEYKLVKCENIGFN